VVPGRLGYFGMVRRYKGVEGLVAAFRGTLGIVDGLSLRIGGTPSTEELARAIRELADGAARIVIELGFLSDAALVELATSSELVVMPYQFMHNSSGAITALSLERPVLVPDNAVNRLLSKEVGPGWVYCYSGQLTAASLITALQELRAGGRAARPELSARDWRTAGAQHVRAYRTAIDRRRGRTGE
jgi:glycosyltransferase involved in cell wall biosynthesis